MLYRMEVRGESLKPWLKYSARIALRITGRHTIRTLTFREHLTSYRGGYRLRVTVWRSLIQNSVRHLKCVYIFSSPVLNRLTPNDTYMGRTAPLTSKRCIFYIYSANTGTEYFKHALYLPSFSLQNAVCFIMLTCLVPVLFTF